MRLPPTFTNADVLTLMLQRLGDRRSEETRARLVTELNITLGQLETKPTLPWFLETTFQFTTQPQIRAYELPSDFLRELEDGNLVLTDTAGSRYCPDKVNLEELSWLPGMPTQYSLFGDTIRLGPVPQESLLGELDYLKSGGWVSDSNVPVSNPWLMEAFDLPVLQTLVRYTTTHLQAPELAATFNALLTPLERDFWRAVEARQHTNRVYMIED